jgi:tRNA (guanosine-2'-O-)-methyltransferase
VKALNPTEIKRLNRSWRRRTEARVRVALVSLSNPFNVGSILRTSAVFGVELGYLVGATPGPEDAKVHKTGLGTEHSVPTARVASLADAVEDARSEGFAIVAVELASTAAAITDHPFGSATCLVIGSEGHGLSPASLALCDAAVYLPQPGRVASLNVAAATSIAIFEVRRREWTAAPGRGLDARP